MNRIVLFFLVIGALLTAYLLFSQKSPELRAMEKAFNSLQIKTANRSRVFINDNGTVLGKPTYAQITAVYVPEGNNTLNDVYSEITNALSTSGWSNGQTDYLSNNIPTYKSELGFKDFILEAKVIIVSESNGVNLYIDSTVN